MQLTLGLTPEPMRVCVLGSGSAGNAVVVESAGQRLLLDAGFSCREIERRLAEVGAGTAGFLGLVLTHEHGDHSRGALRFAKRRRVPIWATAGTSNALHLEERGARVEPLAAGRPAVIGGFQVTPFRVPHDAAEPVGLVVEDARGRRLGLVTDIGAPSREAWRSLQDLDALVLETNHDVEMLRTGPYPWPLKQRVASARGHLSNRAAAESLPELLSSTLEWIVLYHLSRTNNRPSIAHAEIGEALAREGSSARMCVTRQAAPSRWLELGESPSGGLGTG